MKSITTLFIAMLFFIGASAQTIIEKDQITYKKELAPALMLKMEIPTDNSKDLFKQFMSDKYDLKVKGLGFLANKDEVLVENAKLTAFKINPITILAKFTNVDNENTTVKFAIMDAQNRFVSPKSSSHDFDALSQFMEEFNDFAIKTYVANEVEKLTAELKTKEKDLRDAEEDISDHQKQIAEKEREITEHKREVEDLATESKSLDKRIRELNNSINTARSKLKNVR